MKDSLDFHDTLKVNVDINEEFSPDNSPNPEGADADHKDVDINFSPEDDDEVLHI